MRSRFNGSKRVRRTSPFEKYLNKTKQFLINLDKVVVTKSALFLVLIVVFLFLLTTVYGNYRLKAGFERNVVEFAALNSETLFEIDDITLYSSANGTPSADGNGRIDISQFTDISFNIKNIKNRKIQELSIMNITFPTAPEIGIPTLVYKNPLEFGKLTNFDTETSDTIDFKALNSDQNINYAEPYVLNNLSNPITLEYVNNNVKSNFGISTSTTSLAYDGRLLKEANVNLANISCSISFHVQLVTSEGETYKCKVGIDIPLKLENTSIYDGNILETAEVNVYPFYCIR